MLIIKLPGEEYWDEVNEIFINGDEKSFELEHSLFAISKWEEKWHKPFLEEEKLSNDELLDYIRCMVIGDIDQVDLYRLVANNIDKISNYISDKKTATWFNDNNQNGSSNKKEIITAEIVYYWMNELNIDLACEHWHFNKLMAYIRVCSIKRQPPKKMSKSEISNRNRALNAARRARTGSKG